MGNRTTSPSSPENQQLIVEWTSNWNCIQYKAKVLRVRQFIQTLSPKIVDALSKKLMYEDQSVGLLIAGYTKSKQQNKLYQDIYKIIAMYIGELYLINSISNKKVNEIELKKIRRNDPEKDDLVNMGLEVAIVDNYHFRKMNILMQSRALNLLCQYDSTTETLFIKFSLAEKAITKLLNGNISEMGQYDNNKYVHVSDWWAELIDNIFY